MIELPICIPKFQTLPGHTAGLSILYALDERIADAWVANNCISVCFLYHEDEDHLPYLQLMPVYTLSSCCLFEIFKYPYTDFELNHYNHMKSLHDFIKNSLENQRYVSTSVDAYFLSCHSGIYKSHHFCHPIIVYGMEGNILKVADHFIGSGGKFCLSEVSIDEFYKGLISAHEEYQELNYLPNIYTIKLKEDYNDYFFSKRAVKSSLSQYINSDIVIGSNMASDNYFSKYKVGYDGLTAFLEYFKNLTEFNGIHVRLAHELYTHTQIISLVAEQTQLFVERSKENMRYAL